MTLAALLHGHCYSFNGRDGERRILAWRVPSKTQSVASSLRALRVRVPYPPGGPCFWRFHADRCRMRRLYGFQPRSISRLSSCQEKHNLKLRDSKISGLCSSRGRSLKAGLNRRSAVFGKLCFVFSVELSDK